MLGKQEVRRFLRPIPVSCAQQLSGSTLKLEPKLVPSPRNAVSKNASVPSNGILVFTTPRVAIHSSNSRNRVSSVRCYMVLN